MRSPGSAGAQQGPAADDFDGGSERGSLTLMLLILTVPLLALAGLVVDGGAKLNAKENANAVAQEAARAGAGIVNRGNAYATGNFTVDQGQALVAARQYLTAAGFQGSASPAGPTAIAVSVTVTEPTRILSIIGIDSVGATGSATASLVTGVTGPGT